MKKNTILFFVLLIAASLLLFIHTFSVLAHTPERTGGEGLWVNFLMNLLLYPYRVCGLSGGQVASKAISRPERHTNCIEYLADGTAGGTVCRCYQLCHRTVVCTSIQHRGQRIPYYVMEQPYRAFHRTVFL